MEKTRKLAKGLFILWVVCFMIFNVGSSIYASYQQAIVGYDPTVFLGGFQLFTFGIVSLCFLPFMAVIHHLVKRSCSEKLRTISFYLLILMGIWDVCMLICTIFAYIAPETFASIIGAVRCVS